MGLFLLRQTYVRAVAKFVWVPERMHPLVECIYRPAVRDIYRLCLNAYRYSTYYVRPR